MNQIIIWQERYLEESLFAITAVFNCILPPRSLLPPTNKESLGATGENY